jgi:hypothetical protein
VIVACAIALLVMPAIVLRRMTLASCYGALTGVTIIAAIVWRRLPHDAPYLAAVVFMVIELSIIALFIASGNQVRWSANRAAAIAAIVYALTIPAMTRVPLDGDEPYYLVITESLVHDGDLDLSNQYRDMTKTASGRKDLQPQMGDPRGSHGEIYSRQEPFLALLMVPGYLFGGLFGSVATIALFGVLLVRSTVRWMEEHGIDERSIRAVVPLFAFGPPVLFYATRIWPEVPAAFCLVEAFRGLDRQRPRRWVTALLGLVLLKLRFVLVALGVVAIYARQNRKAIKARTVALVAALLAVPLAIMYFISGSATNVHSLSEMIPASPMKYATGLAGLLADGMSGIAFQAPFYLIALHALTRRNVPRAFRAALASTLLYVFYLLPRSEWHGGWSPPLRYLVFLMPVLAFGAASVWQRVSRGFIAVAATATAGLVIFGVTTPWHMFHIANGENSAGEFLSRLYGSDFSRLFPSFIRPNSAAWIGAAAVVAIVIAMRRMTIDLAIPAASLAIAAALLFGRQPGSGVEFEDAHVIHEGGTLYPKYYTVMRFAFRGGWTVFAGDAMSFHATAGDWTLRYESVAPAAIEIEGKRYELTPATYGRVRVHVPSVPLVTLRCVEGAANLDGMEHD